MTRGGERERGSLSLEAALLTPALVLVLVLGIVFGRIAHAGGFVDNAARDAARAASLERDATSARIAAAKVAGDDLSGQNLRCLTWSLAITTAGFSAALGAPASTTAVVTCTVRLSDIGMPGLPGTKTLRSQFTSPLDAYRQRPSQGLA